MYCVDSRFVGMVTLSDIGCLPLGKQYVLFDLSDVEQPALLISRIDKNMTELLAKAGASGLLELSAGVHVEGDACLVYVIDTGRFNHLIGFLRRHLAYSFITHAYFHNFEGLQSYLASTLRDRLNRAE